MKSYRNTAATLVLALTLTSPVFAGVMHTGNTGPDPQPTPTATRTNETITTNGVMQTGEAAPMSEATDTATAIALNLLQSVLSLF